MAIANFAAKYRTLKIGFLVQQDNILDLLEAVKINTLLWGGIHNPIIPVNPNAKDIIDLIGCIPVDVLHPISHDENANAIIAAFPFLKSPRHFTYEMFEEDWHTKKRSPVYLDSLNIIEKNYHKYFKGRPAKKGYSNCVLPKWSSTDPLTNIFSLTFGTYNNDFNLEEDFENAFLNGLRAKKISIEQDKPLNGITGEKIDPIILTGLDLKDYRAESSFRSNGVYLGDANNFDDLIYFWNLRAIGLQIKFLPIEGHERFADFIESHLSRLISLAKKSSFPRPLSFYYRNKKEEEIEQIYTDFKKGRTFISKSDITKCLLSNLLHGLPTDYLSWEISSGFVEQSFGKCAVNIILPEKKFITHETDRDISKQAVVASLDFFGVFGDEDCTLKLPYIRALNEFYSREISIDPWKIRSEEGSIGIIINLDDKSHTLYPMDYQALIKKIFDLAGIKAQMSQAGLIAHKIIEKIGGLEDARVLKIKGVRKILQEGNQGSSITRGEATRTIHENDFHKYKKLFIEAREDAELKSDAVFDYLLKKDYFRAGLELLCGQCKLNNWLALKNIDDFWTCEYCGAQNQTSIHLKTRGDWRFRKSGLFAKDNHQEGAIPVLLTLLAIKRVMDHSNFVYSTALELNGDGIKCETDLFIINYDHRNKIQIAIGECKSDGGSITRDDCDKLMAVKNKLSESNHQPDVFIVFSKTSDIFLPEEINVFKDMKKAGANLILLTNKENEPYHIYWLEEGGFEEDVPERYPHSFFDLARNSSARYLKEL